MGLAAPGPGWLGGLPAGLPDLPEARLTGWPLGLSWTAQLWDAVIFFSGYGFFFRGMLIFAVFLLEFVQNGASHWTHLGPILGPRSGSICSCSCLAGWLEGRPARAAWYAADWLAEWRAGWLLGLSWKARLWDHIPFAFQGGRLIFVGSAGFCKTQNLEQLNGA